MSAFTQGSQSGFDRALEESAERLRDMTREIEGAARGLGALGGGDAPRSGGGVGEVGGGGRSGGGLGFGRIGSGAVGLALGVGASSAGQGLQSFGRAGDPTQAFLASAIQTFDFTGAHKPARVAGAATLGILGQAAAAGAGVSREDVSREFSFQLTRAERMRQVEHLVDEEVSTRVTGRWEDAALDTLRAIEEGIRGLPDKLNPFGGGGSR